MCDLIKFSFRQGFSDIIGESVNVIYNADNFVPNPVREVGLCSAYQTRVPTTSVYFVGVDAIEPQFVYTIGDSAALQGLDVRVVFCCTERVVLFSPWSAFLILVF